MRVYFPWQKIEPFEGDTCLRLKNWFCSCVVWMSGGLWGWMKKAKQNGGRKAFTSCGRFLSRNKEPRSSQSLWFIITLGIQHSCPTFCIRVFKTEFVLPKLSSGSSSSSWSSASCWGNFSIAQFVQTFTANKHIKHLSVAEHETGHNLINLRQIWNL